MMRAAQIENGVVVNLWEVPSLDCYGDMYKLVEAPKEVVLGAHYEDGKFINPIEKLKAAKHAQIQQERDAARYAPVEVAGHKWQMDPHSQQLLLNAILLTQVGVYTPTVWRSADNEEVPVTYDTLLQIAEAIATQTHTAYVTSWARKRALEEVATAEDIKHI